MTEPEKKVAKPTVEVELVECQTLDEFASAPASTLTDEQREEVRVRLASTNPITTVAEELRLAKESGIDATFDGF